MPAAAGASPVFPSCRAAADPRVRLFMVNGGGHLFCSSVQNPAWDFSWAIEDHPLDEPVGFEGKLVYARFGGPDTVLARYEEGLDTR